MKITVHTLAVVALLVPLAMTSCSLGLSPDTTGPADDLARVDGILNITANSAVATADAQLAAASSVGASTTYNNPGMTPIAVAAGGSENLPARNDYPYPGWTTTGTVERIADPAAYGSSRGWTRTPSGGWSGYNLFRMTAVASPDTTDVYPEDRVREVYYLVDTTGTYGDFAGGGDDSIFDPYGWSGSGYRDEYVSEYTDGSTRDHWVIVPDTSSSYAAFDVNGSLDFETAVGQNLSVDSSAAYSSAVMYTQELNRTYNFWFWNDNNDVKPVIIGWRYYTEHVVGSELVATSVTFEYTYNGDYDRRSGYPSLLARTVIREETRFSWDGSSAGAATGHTIRLRTEINSSSDGGDLVYTRQGKQITEWSNRGNARDSQLAGVQRDTLPSNYQNVASELDVTLTRFE